MPVTYTAKRALRSSAKKAFVNKKTLTELEIAVRQAKKLKTKDLVTKAISLADKASKKHAIHKNKANRLKSTLSKLIKTQKTKKATKKTSKKK